MDRLVVRGVHREIDKASYESDDNQRCGREALLGRYNVRYQRYRVLVRNGMGVRKT
jgi:hypothetical protein